MRLNLSVEKVFAQTCTRMKGREKKNKILHNLLVSDVRLRTKCVSYTFFVLAKLRAVNLCKLKFCFLGKYDCGLSEWILIV